ncbi:MAG: hypothetical protein EA397_09770 [Deltaproteobacteria bacterium]|nr:MAG: hypothetical protein EA397_09770 [Deltaproteobacteria bacterium]
MILSSTTLNPTQSVTGGEGSLHQRGATVASQCLLSRTPVNAVILFFVTSCFTPESSQVRLTPPSGAALDLLDPVDLTLPPNTRGDLPVREQVDLTDWRPTADGLEAPLPSLPRALFFHRPPEGMSLSLGETRLPSHPTEEPGVWWSVSQTVVRLNGASESLDVGSAVLHHPLAAERERRRHLDSASLSPVDFVRYQATVHGETAAGLLLPAPARLSVAVDLPPHPRLRATARLLPPELADLPASDGARAEVWLHHDRGAQQLWSADLSLGDAAPVDLDLTRWAGQSVTIELRTTPKSNNIGDQVFFADPRIASTRSEPRRVVLIFIDTLRADRTSAYGFDLDTTPALSRIASQGTRFTNARSVAPWTLPSYRAAVTGRHPHAWGDATTLAERLRSQGWATAMFAGNVYLSRPFEGPRGWGEHHVARDPAAPDQVREALAWLNAQEHDDALLLVHLMDPHLPYLEPASHRDRFAGPAPQGWPEAFTRPRVLAEDPTPEVQAWIHGRYLNNIRYADDALGVLAEALRPEDLLLVFSDHGEEFWEHGGFEHGHSLAEELLRIPVVIRGAGVPVEVRDDPVSLLDLVPTILAWLDLPDPSLDGQNLLAGPTSATRALPVGEPLYGLPRWGVVRGDRAFQIHRGEERLLDLSDPTGPELPWSDQSEGSVTHWRGELARAHKATLLPSLRVQGSGRAHAPESLALTLQDPIVHEHHLPSPLGGDRLVPNASPGGVQIAIPQGWLGVHEVHFLSPTLAKASTIQIDHRRGESTASPQLVEIPAPHAPRRDVLVPTPAGAILQFGAGLVLIPDGASAATVGFDPELRDMLRASGYLLDPEPDPPSQAVERTDRARR